MSNPQPSQTDRIVSHAVVGLATGAVVGRKAGWPGFIAGAVVAVAAHEILDAPVAGVIAQLDLG